MDDMRAEVYPGIQGITISAIIGLIHTEPITPMTTPNPDPETEQQRRDKSERYFQLSRWLLKHAQEQLDLGDTMQASEKAYGAVAHAVKACAELRGWNH